MTGMLPFQQANEGVDVTGCYYPVVLYLLQLLVPYYNYQVLILPVHLQIPMYYPLC